MWAAGIFEFAMSIITLAIPVHMYFHIKGAYSLSWFSALWRTAFLLVFCVLALSLFFLASVVLGLTG
jgi:ABC-type phosphate transport system permease subunit